MRIDLAGKVLSRSRLTRWKNSPVAWARDCLPTVSLATYQEEILDAIPVKKRVAVRGPHGLGKTMQAALVVNWFATTREMMGAEWKIITTASAWRHLEVYLWPEIHKWAGRIDFETLGRAPYNPRSELLDLRLKLRNGAATAVASNTPERIEGAHAEELLYLLDEAKIIPPATWDSIEGAFSNAGTDTADNAYAFAISTPGPPSGRFYDIHRRAPGYEDWWTRHVTLDEAIGSGRISRNWAEQRRIQWGADSAIYHNRVLGEFHASDEDAVIPLAWIEAAIERWHDWNRSGRPSLGGPTWVGTDVGRGGDESVLAHRDGPAVWLESHRRRDTMSTVAMLQGLDARPIIDVIGVGAGVFDRAKEVGLRAVAYAGSEKAHTRDRSRKYGFTTVRSAAYWNLREALEPEFEPTIMLPPDDLMISDLTTPTWTITSGVPPKIQVEPKDKVVERLGRSPDRGDACFVAGTMIATESGEVPIEKMRPGMRVWTREGLRDVLTAGKTGALVPVIEATLADGRTLTGTGNHPVWDGSTFRPMDTFAMSDSMWTWGTYPCFTGGSSSPGTPRASDGTSGSTTGRVGPIGAEGSRHSMSRSIKRRLGQSRRDGTSITRTATRWTTDLKTWKHSLRRIMPTDIFSWRGDDTVSPTPNTCGRYRSWRKPGTPPLRAVSGTLSTENVPGRDENGNRDRRVSVVALKSRLSNPVRPDADGAPTRAMFGGTTETRSIAWNGNARSADPLFGVEKPSLAPVPVVHICVIGTASVWNLEVDGQPEYFANGVLVHNCVMAFWADRNSGAGGFARPVGSMPVSRVSGFKG